MCVGVCVCVSTWLPFKFSGKHKTTEKWPWLFSRKGRKVGKEVKEILKVFEQHLTEWSVCAVGFKIYINEPSSLLAEAWYLGEIE